MNQITVFLCVLRKMILFWTCFFMAQAYGLVQITDVLYEQVGEKEGQIKVLFTGQLDKAISYSKRDDLVQLEFPNASVWPKIDKKVLWNNDPNGAQLLAYQFDKNLVRVRYIFPVKMNFSLSNTNDDRFKLNINYESNTVLFRFPIDISLENSPEKGSEKFQDRSDEQFVLNELEKEEGKQAQKKEDLAPQKTLSLIPKTDATIKIKKTETQTPGMYEYLVKVVSFMVVILLFFYGIVSLFKKNILKKNNLGFLKNENLVTVISQNYLSPKRSLITVKVLDQVFLIANWENGMSFLSELHSVAQVLKQSEKNITGKNFDDSLEKNLEKEVGSYKIKEKDDILKSVEDKVSLGSQLKEKMKKLKPLQ